MNHTPRGPYTIDGFVSSNRGRTAGVTGGVRTPNGTMPNVRMRRPGFHEAPARRDFSGSATPAHHRPLRATDSSHNILPTPRPHAANHHSTHIASKKHKVARPRWKKFSKRASVVLALFVLVSAGWLGWKIFHNSSKVFGNGSNLLGFLSATKLRGEDQGRVNILLAGNSADDAGHNGGNLTDSIMLLSLDTRHNKAFMLSIPRDLYVNIPGNGYAKINEAYYDGKTQNFKESGFPPGGMGLLAKVVNEDFGLPIHYYALINYSALRDAVNAVGGVRINIQSENPHGLYDPSVDWTTHGPMVKLSNGWHTLNGREALNLARARGDAYGSYGFPQSDFDRTEHQRELLTALKSKTSTAGVIANPIKLGQLFDAFGKNVHTDFKTGEIRRLYDLSKIIKESSIKSASLNDADGANLLANQTSSTGQSVLVPAAGMGDYSQIKLFIKKLTSNDPVVQEGANVVVLNGSGVDGLAATQKTELTDKNFNVVSVATAPNIAKTTIVDVSKGKKPATLQALRKRFGNTVTTSNTYGYPSADFIVVLGLDQKQHAPQ